MYDEDPDDGDAEGDVEGDSDWKPVRRFSGEVGEVGWPIWWPW